MTEDTSKRCFKCPELRVDDVDGKTRISGLAVPYNAPSEDLGGFREIFKPGAFKDSLAGADDIFADVDHDGTKRIGRRSAGSVEFKDGRDGLRVTITPPDTTAGRDAVEEVRSGLLDGMSICFCGAEDSYKGKGDSIIREIGKATLRAVTLTSYPAYRQTAGTVSVRSLDEYRAAIEPDHAEAEKLAAEQRAKDEADAAAVKAAEEAEVARLEQSRQAHAEIDRMETLA